MAKIIESIFLQINQTIKFKESEDEDFLQVAFEDAILASMIDQTYLKQKNNSNLKKQIWTWAESLYGVSSNLISALSHFYSFIYTFSLKLEIISVDFRASSKDFKQDDLMQGERLNIDFLIKHKIHKILDSKDQQSIRA